MRLNRVFGPPDGAVRPLTRQERLTQRIKAEGGVSLVIGVELVVKIQHGVGAEMVLNPLVEERPGARRR